MLSIYMSYEHSMSISRIRIMGILHCYLILIILFLHNLFVFTRLNVSKYSNVSLCIRLDISHLFTHG